MPQQSSVRSQARQLQFLGRQSFSNTLAVSGAATIVGKISSSAAAVLGPTIVSNTLAVSGAAELSGTVTLQSFISGNFAFPPYAGFTKLPCVYLSGSTVIDPGYSDEFIGQTPYNAGLFQFGLGKNTGSFTVHSNAPGIAQTHDGTHPDNTVWGLQIAGANTVYSGPVIRFDHSMSVPQMNTAAQVEHGRISAYAYDNTATNALAEVAYISMIGGVQASSSTGRYAAVDIITYASGTAVPTMRIGQHTTAYAALLTANSYGGLHRPSGSIQIGGDVLLEFDQTPGLSGKGNPGAHIVFAGNGNTAADAGDGFLHISGSSKGIALSGTVISLDSATNLLDGNISSSAGATFGGAAVISNTLAVSGAISPGAGGLQQTLPVVLTDGDATLTIAANAGRTNVIPDTGANRTYKIPTPTATGQYYHFIYGGAAADAHDNILQTVTGDNSVYFKGSIVHLDSDSSGDNVTTVYSNGSSNSKLTINNAEMIDIHFLAFSTTVWYVWGTIVSDTVHAIANQ